MTGKHIVSMVTTAAGVIVLICGLCVHVPSYEDMAWVDSDYEMEVEPRRQSGRGEWTIPFDTDDWASGESGFTFDMTRHGLDEYNRYYGDDGYDYDYEFVGPYFEDAGSAKIERAIYVSTGLILTLAGLWEAAGCDWSSFKNKKKQNPAMPSPAGNAPHPDTQNPDFPVKPDEASKEQNTGGFTPEQAAQAELSAANLETAAEIAEVIDQQGIREPEADSAKKDDSKKQKSDEASNEEDCTPTSNLIGTDLESELIINEILENQQDMPSLPDQNK